MFHWQAKVCTQAKGAKRLGTKTHGGPTVERRQPAPREPIVPNPKLTLLDPVREVIRFKSPLDHPSSGCRVESPSHLSVSHFSVKIPHAFLRAQLAIASRSSGHRNALSLCNLALVQPSP